MIIDIHSGYKTRKDQLEGTLWKWFAILSTHTNITPVEIRDFYCYVYLRKTVVMNRVSTEIPVRMQELDTLGLLEFMLLIRQDAMHRTGLCLEIPIGDIPGDSSNRHIMP